jgi:hypothetical protein
MTTEFPGITMVVETGAGLTNANSYVDLTYATNYHIQFGNKAWTQLTDISKQQEALIQATQSIDILYGQEFYSIPRSQGISQQYPQQAYLQALLFPRFTMVINQIQVLQTGYIPDQLKKAVCEVALMYINGVDIFPQPNLLKFTTNKQIKAGSTGISTTYGRDIDTERYTGFWKVEKIIYPLLKKSSNPTYLSL